MEELTWEKCRELFLDPLVCGDASQIRYSYFYKVLVGLQVIKSKGEDTPSIVSDVNSGINDFTWLHRNLSDTSQWRKKFYKELQDIIHVKGCPMEELPLYINSFKTVEAIAKYRLKNAQ